VVAVVSMVAVISTVEGVGAVTEVGVLDGVADRLVDREDDVVELFGRPGERGEPSAEPVAAQPAALGPRSQYERAQRRDGRGAVRVLPLSRRWRKPVSRTETRTSCECAARG